jgi:4-hydroxybenzoate polyprenyltransferase
MDESGLAEGLGYNGLVVGRRGIQLLQRKFPGLRIWTTIIECVSAEGRPLPPLIIFKGKHVQKQWFPADFEEANDWLFHATENGWTDDQTGVKWLSEVFIPNTQPTTPELRLLVLDGHGSHVTPQFMAFCL